MGGNEILHEDRSLRVMTRKNLGVAVWTGTPGVAQIRTLSRTSERFMKSWPAGQAFVSVIVRSTPNFPQDVRDELVKMMKNRPYTLGTAHLILVDGLAGTAVRAFMSTVMLLARPPAPHRVFGKESDAVTWLHGQLQGAPEPWTQKELLETLQEAVKGR